MRDENLINQALNTLIAKKVDTKVENSYWVASRYYHYSTDSYWHFIGRMVTEDGQLLYSDSFYFFLNGTLNGAFRKNPIRPILTLKSNITNFSGEGTAEQPYVLN